MAHKLACLKAEASGLGVGGVGPVAQRCSCGEPVAHDKVGTDGRGAWLSCYLLCGQRNPFAARIAWCGGAGGLCPPAHLCASVYDTGMHGGVRVRPGTLRAAP